MPVAATVAIVRPWKPLCVAMISCAPSLWMRPHLRASLSAPSFASAPEFEKKTWSSGECSMRSCASSIWGSL